jgi:CHAD domain-containing protein
MVYLYVAMAFCFKKKESVAAGISRLYRERIDIALEQLKNGDRQDAAHNVRREVKKVRAILRLVRAEISAAEYRRLTATLREAAGRLTALRNLHAALGALTELTRRCDLPSAAPARNIKSDLQGRSRAQEKRLGRAVPAVRRALEQLRDATDLCVAADDWITVGKGLKKTYRRGRKAYRTVLATPTARNFHEWRKRVKDLWHQLRLLRPALSRKWCGTVDGLEDLAGDLGDDHDLEVLKELVKARSRPSSRALKELMVCRQKKLRATAIEAGARYYSEKPSHFHGRLKKCWHRWRGTK